MVDDDRYPFAPGEVAQMRRVRFRTLGCWPLTAAIESDATTLDAVIAETLGARGSERKGRLIDSDVPGSMEKKKQEFYSVGAAPPPRMPVMILRQCRANQQHSHWSPSLCELSDTTVSLYPA